MKRCDHREAADKLGYHSEAQQVVRLDEGKVLVRRMILFSLDIRAEADGILVHAACDYFLESFKCTSADEEDVLRIEADERLFRVFPSTLRGDSCHGAFEDLEQRLLHAFAGDIPRDRSAVALAGDFIDFIDVHDSTLGP